MKRIVTLSLALMLLLPLLPWGTCAAAEVYRGVYGENVRWEINMETVSFAYGVEVIDEGAFGECTALEKVALPDSLERIGKDVFRGCTRLREVKFPRGL